MDIGNIIKKIDLMLNYLLEKIMEIKYIMVFWKKMIDLDMAFY